MNSAIALKEELHPYIVGIDFCGDPIKNRFKELVKRHHPDANGGDRASEDKLREILEAYNYLKSTGLC